MTAVCPATGVCLGEADEDGSKGMEAVMEVKISIEVDGKPVAQRTATMEGTQEQMEETAIALGCRIARETLQASVNAVDAPRTPPFFQSSTVPCDTKAMRPER